jgi:hypothetical protein
MAGEAIWQRCLCREYRMEKTFPQQDSDVEGPTDADASWPLPQGTFSSESTTLAGAGCSQHRPFRFRAPRRVLIFRTLLRFTPPLWPCLSLALLILNFQEVKGDFAHSLC